MISKKVIAASAAVVGLVGAGTAQAAYIVSYGHTLNGSRTVPLTVYDEAIIARDLFFDGGNPAVQDFEGFDAGTKGPLDIVFGSGDSAVTARLLGTGGEVLSVPTTGPNDGRYSVSGNPAAPGNKFWGTRASSSGDTFELWFDNPVVQFGFFGVDVGDFGGILELELLGNDPITGDETVIGTVGPSGAVVDEPAEGSVLYFGVTATNSSEWFTGVRFRSFAPGRAAVTADVFAFDSFTVVGAPTTPTTPVPAPGSLALLGLALTGLALMRRRA